MEQLIIKPIEKNEWEEAMRLAWDTFVLFEAPEYSREGIKAFKNFVNDPILKSMFLEGKYRAVGAYCDGLLVGIMGIRNENHLSLLFVDSEYHRRGIATRLIQKGFNIVYNEYGKKEMTVNSSPYAVGFYHKMGFVDTNIEITTDGIRYTPMINKFFKVE